MTLADHLAGQLRKSLGVCRKQRRVCLKSDSPDAVHDMRVSCRRVLEPLRVFEQVLRPRPIEPLRDALRAWMRLSGAVRDLDIAADLVSRSQIQGSEDVLAALLRRRDQQAAKAAAQLQLPIRWPGKDEIRQWLRASKRSSHETLWDLDLSTEENGALALPLLMQRYAMHGDLLQSPDAARETFHRFRLRTKRVRYAVEWFVELFPDTGAPALAATLRDFQQSLGALQDTAAASLLLEKPSLRKHASEDTWRSFHAFLETEAAIAQQRFLKGWASFSQDASLARWQAIFPLPEGTDTSLAKSEPSLLAASRAS